MTRTATIIRGRHYMAALSDEKPWFRPRKWQVYRIKDVLSTDSGDPIWYCNTPEEAGELVEICDEYVERRGEAGEERK